MYDVMQLDEFPRGHIRTTTHRSDVARLGGDWRRMPCRPPAAGGLDGTALLAVCTARGVGPRVVAILVKISF